jgi:large subunit ribosomal protein L25
MESLNLPAVPRPETGKGNARKARRAGRTPGVLYNAGGAATPISFDVAAAATIFRKTGDPNTLVNVQVSNERDHLCLVREIQRDPVSRDVTHVDFYEVTPDYRVTVDVAVATVGRAAGTRAGGTMRLLTRTVRVSCPAGQIPRVIEADVTPLEVGQFLRISQIPAPPDVTILYSHDFNVVAVEGKRASKEEAAAAAAVAPAAGAAKPAAAAAAAKPAAGAAKPAAAAPAKPAAKK